MTSSTPHVSEVEPEEFLTLRWWLALLLDAYEQNLYHIVIEMAGGLFILYLLTRKPTKPKSKLTKREQDELIREWEPQPLVPTDKKLQKPRNLVIDSGTGPYVEIKGEQYLNLGSFNFLDLGSNEDIKEACKQTIDKYGVGSCGPRGFYGTVDKHLEIEERIAKFYGVTQAILYPDSVACVSSVIPAFAKKGDVIVCDDGANFSIQNGIQLSRSNVLYFKHNDMKDLENVLGTLAEKQKTKANAKLVRRFIVVEGISVNYGDICPLKNLIAISKKYKYRLVLDDTVAMGLLGKTGRGTAEHFNVPISDIDVVCGGLDCSFATLGGFCIGSDQIVDHQRLSGAGYVFSASGPMYLCTAGISAMDLIDEKPEICEEARKNATVLRKAIARIPGVTIKGDSVSPVVHIRVKRSERRDEEDTELLTSVMDALEEQKILITVSRYVPQERAPPAPSLIVKVTAGHSEKDIKRFATALTAAFKSVFSGKL